MILCKNKNIAFFLASVWWQVGASSQPQCSRSLWDRLFFSLKQACHQPSRSCPLTTHQNGILYTLCPLKDRGKKATVCLWWEKAGRKKTPTLSLCPDSSRRGPSGFVQNIPAFWERALLHTPDERLGYNNSMKAKTLPPKTEFSPKALLLS